MFSVDIRAATRDDQPLLLELQRRSSLANPGDRELLLARPEIITLPAEHLTAETACVAEASGRPVGFAVVLKRTDGDADLDALFVEPDCWRRGVGRRLLESAVDLARAMGATTLHVIGNTHAEGFYRAMGFTELGMVMLQYGVGLLMQLPL